jgi:hypothetical protein
MVEPALWGRRRLVPLYHTKVFADDMMRKIIDVTLGELLTFLQRISDPISNTKWEARRQE